MTNQIEFGFENVDIPASEGTPSIKLDVSGYIEIKGVSIPEDTLKFYNSFNHWIKTYCTNPKAETTVDIGLIYVNSSSSVMITGMINALNKIVDDSHVVTINWFYEEGDEEMKDVGEMYKSESACNILIHEVPE